MLHFKLKMKMGKTTIPRSSHRLLEFYPHSRLLYLYTEPLALRMPFEDTGIWYSWRCAYYCVI